MDKDVHSSIICKSEKLDTVYCQSSGDWISSDESRQWKILPTMILKIGKYKPHTSVRINLKNTLLIQFVKIQSCTLMICVLFV